VERHAQEKLIRKKCDLIVANNVAEAGAGFGTETNIVSVYSPDGLVEHIPQMTKRAVAERLWDLAETRMKDSIDQKNAKGTEQ
jgi:phosphopantothenoylcysteine decarboxylase/phosphopantothenate--cysteine ligase